VRAEANQIDHGGNTIAELAGGNAGQSPVKDQQLGRRQPFVKAEVFRKETDLSPHIHIVRRRAQHESLAAGWFHKAKQHLDRTALPRSVGSQETENFAAAHRQGEVTHCNLVPKDFAQILGQDSQATRLSQ